MKTSGERIAEATLDAMNGRIEVFSEESGKCLRVTRQIIQAGLDLSYENFYAFFRRTAVDDRPFLQAGQPGFDPWARDVMKTLRELGYRVAFEGPTPVVYSDIMPGDILCSWELAEPQGHIAVCLTGGVNALAFENTGTLRGEHIMGNNRLTRVDNLTLLRYGSWEVFRLPDVLPDLPVLVTEETTSPAPDPEA